MPRSISTTRERHRYVLRQIEHKRHVHNNDKRRAIGLSSPSKRCAHLAPKAAEAAAADFGISHTTGYAWLAGSGKAGPKSDSLALDNAA